MKFVSANNSLGRFRDASFGALAAIAAIALLGWTQGTPDVQRARRFEVVDKDGKVRAKVEQGLVALYGAAGKELARLTSDETNGNLVLFGAGSKRLEVFMDPETPRAVFYGPSGRPTAVFPPP